MYSVYYTASVKHSSKNESLITMHTGKATSISGTVTENVWKKLSIVGVNDCCTRKQYLKL